MKQKIIVMRAVVAYITLRALRVVSIVFGIAIVMAFVDIWVLAYYFGAWLWWLALPLPISLILFLILRFVVLRIVAGLHRHPFTAEQRECLESFTRKVTELAETRSTPLFFYALVTLRDIIRDRDATTIRQLIDNSSSLKRDFAELERHFGER